MNFDDEFKTEEDEYSQTKFTFDTSHEEKIYIPRRRYNYFKISALVLGSFIGIMIICLIFAAVFPKMENSDKAFVKQGNLLRSLFIVAEKNIWAFDVENDKFSILKTTKNEIVAIDTYLDNTLYWSENNSNTITALYTNYPNITHTKKLKPQTIAFDHITEKVYLIDKTSGTLNVVDKSGKHHAMLISNLNNPHDLVLDPAEGLVFIVQYNQSIIRANMDGTSITKIIDSPGISAITLDTKTMKIYWANEKKNIEISDYDGNRRSKIIDNVDMGVDSMVVFDNRLFWTSSPSMKNALPYSRVLWSCSLSIKTCENITFYKLPFEKPTLIRTFFREHQSQIKNPCERNNNGCQHLCLMTSRGNHDCVCNIGWKLNPDGKTCTNNITMIVYIQDNFVRGKMLNENKDISVDTIIPTKIYMNNLKKKTVIYFDYDMISGKFYFTDDHSLYCIDLHEGGDQKTILNVSQNFVIGRIAFDWMTDKIYFVLQSQSMANNHSIEEFSLKNENASHTSVVSYKSIKDSLIINCPLSLMIHPIKKYLFYILYDRSTDYIQRLMIDNKGMKPLSLSNTSATYFELITLNIGKSELYYVEHNDAQTIKIKDLDGRSLQSVPLRKAINSVKFVGFHENSFYIGNFTGIWQINRETGESEREISRSINEDTGKIHSMRIYSFSDRQIV